MIDIQAAIDLLENSQGENINKIFIPSAGKELGFKPLNTGQQKTISKFAFNIEQDEFNIEDQLIKLALFDSLGIDKSYKSTTLKEIDMVAFFAGVRKLNIVSPIRLTVVCDNKECGQEFTISLNLDDIIKKCREYEFKEIPFEKESKGRKYSLSYQTLLLKI